MSSWPWRSSVAGRPPDPEGSTGAGVISRALPWLLLVVGTLLLAEVATTLVWQEPFSALSSSREQSRLSRQLREAESAALAAPTGFAVRGDARGAVIARRYRRQAAPGDPLGRIQIRDLDLNFVFVANASGDSLRKGPGHYSRTALPGERGTVGIAGHRTTYLAPFRHLDKLEAAMR